MTDDDLLCSEADIVKPDPVISAKWQADQEARNQSQSTRGIEYFHRNADWGGFKNRLAEPATDPYEIEKD